MIDGYVNSGKSPYVGVGKEKDTARKENRKYLNLGLTMHTKSPCPHCGRRACVERCKCSMKADEAKRQRAYMVMGATP